MVRLRSPRLKAGAKARVIVLVPEKAGQLDAAGRKSSTVRRGQQDSEFAVARMTRQARGDIAQAKRVRAAIRQKREKLVPWEQVKRELGLK